jgi:hypothetical protein
MIGADLHEKTFGSGSEVFPQQQIFAELRIGTHFHYQTMMQKPVVIGNNDTEHTACSSGGSTQQA